MLANQPAFFFFSSASSLACRWHRRLLKDSWLENDTHSFVIRIWHEAVDREGNAIAWRGFVDHVASGKRLYFHDIHGIVRFIQEQAGLNARPGSKWKSLLAKIRHEAT